MAAERIPSRVKTIFDSNNCFLTSSKVNKTFKRLTLISFTSQSILVSLSSMKGWRIRNAGLLRGSNVSFSDDLPFGRSSMKKGASGHAILER